LTADLGFLTTASLKNFSPGNCRGSKTGHCYLCR